MNFVCLFVLKNLDLHQYIKAFHNGLSIFATPVILTMSGFQHLYHSTSNGLSHNFLIPIIFSNLSLNCSYVLNLRNLQKQVKKASCFKNCTDLSLNLEFQKKNLDHWNNFSHSRSKQFQKQNIIDVLRLQYKFYSTHERHIHILRGPERSKHRT